MKENMQQPHMHVLAMGSSSCRILQTMIQQPMLDVAYYGVSSNLYTLKRLPATMRFYLPAQAVNAISQISMICSHMHKDDLAIFIITEEMPPSSYLTLLKAVKKKQVFTLLFTESFSSPCKTTASMITLADTCMQFALPSFLQYAGMHYTDIKRTYFQQAMQKGIIALHDVIYVPVFINVDYADVRTILKQQKYACIGVGHGKGPHKIVRAIQQAIPTQQIKHRTHAIVHIRMDEVMSLQEVDRIMYVFHEQFGKQMDVILGIAVDPAFKDELQVTILAV